MPSDYGARRRRLELTLWAFLLSLAYYPEYFGFLAWFSLVRPLMIIVSLKGRAAFNASYFFAFLFNAFSIYWIAMVTLPGTVAAVVIVSFYYTAVFMSFHRLYHIRPLLGLVALPLLWTGMEYFRTLSEFAFPWSELGYTQSYYLYITQIVSVISVHGLSFLIVVVNVLLWQVLRKSLPAERRLTAGLAGAATVAALLAYGWVVVPPIPMPGTIRVGLLQGSVPLDLKWKQGNQEHSFRLYDSLAQSLGDSNVALYVWPETSAPCYISHEPDWRERVAGIAVTTNSYHLVGALGARYSGSVPYYYNSCYQFNPAGRITSRYDKVKLVPFSEQVPYQDYFPFLTKAFLRKYLTFIGQGGVQWWSDFRPGDSLVLFELPDHRYAVLICFESAFPEYARQAVRQGADFLVGITNDTWFGRSVGIHMHSRVFITRAIENRAWAVRVANSGITYIVDGYGRIRESLDVFEVASKVGAVGEMDGFSVFTRYGDVVGRFSFLMTLAMMGILIALWVIRRVIRSG